MSNSQVLLDSLRPSTRLARGDASDGESFQAPLLALQLAIPMSCNWGAKQEHASVPKQWKIIFYSLQTDPLV